MNINSVSNSSPTLAEVGNRNPGKEVDAVAASEPDVSAHGVSDAQVKQSVAAINDFLKPVADGIEFSVDQDSGRTLIKVMDTQTKTVIRQIPTLEVVEISKQLDRLQGLLLKEKA